MKPRLLLFDLDGTLLDSSRNIRPASIEVLGELMARGVRVGFATGRSPVSVQRLLDQLPVTGPCILLNGCVLWDVPSASPISSTTLPRADALRLVQATVDLGVHTNVYIGDQLFVRHRGALSLASELKDGVPHVEVPDLVDHVARHPLPPFKLLSIDDSGDFSGLRARFAEVLESDCTIVQSEPTYLEVLPAGVHKGAMFPAIEAHYGITAAEIIAFGDELNDAEMLRAAGRAVVMGNANPAIHHVADDLIGTNDTDALADYLLTILA